MPPTFPQNNNANQNGTNTTSSARMVPNPRPLSIGGMLAWMVVIALTLILVSLVAFEQFSKASQIGGDAQHSDLMQVEIQSKVVIGQNNLNKVLPVADGDLPPTKIPDELDAGCYEQRLIYASLKSELEGPKSAQTYLVELDNRVAELQQQEIDDGVPVDDRFSLTDDQKQMRETIDELLAEYASESFDTSVVSEESKSLLKKRLGFPAEIFLMPEGTADEAQRTGLLQQTATKIIGVAIAGLIAMGAAMIGLGLVIGFPIMIRNNKIFSYFFNSPTDHNIYIQTFAIWMTFFFGSSILLGMLGLDERSGMVAQPIIFFSSLLCLAYPVICGVPFRQVRFDIGWTIDRPLGDVLFSGVSYLATLPCLIPGFVFVAAYAGIVSMFRETHEFARQSGPGHPIQEYIANGDFTMLLLVFITACVAAPIVEETMFRGVLYRHLRDWSQTRARWFSILFSAALNGFIFASIHPQGIAGIPILMSLAVCFSLVREWRNSLLSPMLMHAIHNTIVTCVSLLLL